MHSDALKKIRALPPVKATLMEVCGTHTMSIARNGLKRLLPSGVELLSGPGCPVCVTPPELIDSALELALMDGVTVATYGDMLRVPGSVRGDDLSRRRALGGDVRLVYSPMDALELAEKEPSRQVVFIGVGFETTAPGTAVAVLEAERRGLNNFSVFSMLKRVEPALHSLIDMPDFGVDAFICPGHVAVITGAELFRFLPERYGLPAAVAGFEPEEILEAIYSLLHMLVTGEPGLSNDYARAVSCHGNAVAQGIMNQVFVPCKDIWRGLGLIDSSGLRLRERYAEFDAVKRFSVEFKEAAPGACRCGEIITGKRGPDECPLFGKLCTPADPVGPCMVSSEGACAAAYKYGEVIE